MENELYYLDLLNSGSFRRFRIVDANDDLYTGSECRIDVKIDPPNIHRLPVRVKSDCVIMPKRWQFWRRAECQLSIEVVNGQSFDFEVTEVRDSGDWPGVISLVMRHPQLGGLLYHKRICGDPIDVKEGQTLKIMFETVQTGRRVKVTPHLLLN